MLDNIKILESLSLRERNDLSLFCQKKYLKKGEVLFFEGESASAMYILADGSIEISKKHDGEDVLLGNVHAEEILGEMALFGENSKRMATAKALEDTILITILSFSLDEIIHKYPDLLEKIKNIIEERIVNNKITETASEL
ncbi:cyclic nucleotide-binding domain-containing protein [Candidatus Gracilibacteria bacterium 28_42_T64]|nr:cyclic nucleotide-binding domain-containing protein [Candidatus Gracilibacteria bacterium 28_42_T64]